MTPDQFLAKIAKGKLDAAYVFLGPDAYERDRCRRALFTAALGDEDRESGYTHDQLDQTPRAEAIDDASTLTLFASLRARPRAYDRDHYRRAMLAAALGDMPPLAEAEFLI